MTKPMKGTITSWCFTNGCIYGTLVNSDGTIGESIRTSRVVIIMPQNGIRFVETENSRYILI